MNPSIGEILKKARLEKGLTVEQVSEQTHIRLAYLQALESDERDKLPSDVQGKGFLRLYAGFLNLDLKNLLDRWAGKIPESEGQENKLEPGETAEASTLVLPVQPDQAKDRRNRPGEKFSERPENSTVSEAPTQQISSSEIFTEIGQRLRRQREILGLKLPDVERYILVRQHYLEALENGRLDDLPSPVQGRGMLNNYSRFLELDYDRILLQFAEGLQVRQAERNQAAAQSNTAPFSRRRRINRQAGTLKQFLTPDLIFGGIVIFSLIIFAVWSAANISRKNGNVVESTLPAISKILAVSPTSLENARTTTPSATPTMNPEAVNSGGAGLIDQPAASNGEPATLIPTSAAPLQLYIIARQRAYVQIVADNKVVFNGRVTTGNAYPFSATRLLELRTGNAAGLQVFFNQNDLGTLGVVGQVVSLVFTIDGIQTPTPSASQTPTPTIMPTLTAQPTATLVTPTITPFIP